MSQLRYALKLTEHSVARETRNWGRLLPQAPDYKFGAILQLTSLAEDIGLGSNKGVGLRERGQRR